MALNIFTSNRMEVLVECLGTIFRKPLDSPFTKEVIVVQSKGMQRWLSMELASRLSVWANGHYPFPNAMVQELFETFFSPLPDLSSFTPEVITWKIMRLLPDLLDTPPFATLNHYLADDHTGLKRFQLSEKIADTFDQYTLYRSSMLHEWSSAAIPESEEEAWQAMLWQKLIFDTDGKHRGELKDIYCRRSGKSTTGAGVIPRRITLFGISYLPKFHLDILSAVSKVTEVNLFLLSPTREYWADISSKKATARLTAADRALRSEGNPLLASLGTIGRDFSEMIIELSDEALLQEEEYLDPGRSTLLHALQSDILKLQGTGEDGVKGTIGSDDRSLWIHSCHSPLREIEVLHDNILFLLEEHKELSPRDIVVMTPDIETYSPYITSVFGAGGESSYGLSFSIADRRMMNDGEVASAVLKLLSLYGSRFGASELFDLLALPPVSRRFLLDEEELEIIRGWIEKTGIRWGIDEGDRTGRALPSYRENSWMAGLDRLLLGYAMPDDSLLYNDILPYDDLTGSVAETLGKFAEFVCGVSRFVKSLDRPRPVKEWSRQFEGLLSDFTLPDAGSEREYTAITMLAEQIAEKAAVADFTGDVSPAVFLAWVRARIEQQEQGVGFMTGGVTFCAMLPMRSIPFKVVALIGMNDSAFPRQSRPPGFDLIAKNPCRGDRSLRNEDRYLFLESILSARDILYISYVGQSIKDNSVLPPSVLVSELLDAVQRNFTLPDGDKVEDYLVIRHPLQAFNREYFTTKGPLFSFSVENYRALLEKESNTDPIGPFIREPLKEPPDEWKTVTLEQLLRFYDNPSRFFLEQRLGIRMKSTALPLEDREHFTVDGLELYSMKQELLQIELGGGNPRELLALFRSRGALPPALHGELLFRKIADEVHTFTEVVRNNIGNEPSLEPLDIDLQAGEFRLTGRLVSLSARHQLRYRCSTLKIKDQMRSWIEHIVLNSVAEPGYPLTTTLVMSNDIINYTALPFASSHLYTLLKHYWRGLSKPLLFFPRSSMAYAVKGSLDDARKEWRDLPFNSKPGEGSDPAIQRCFGSEEPFDDEFCSLAAELLGPMIEYSAQDKKVLSAEKDCAEGGR